MTAELHGYVKNVSADAPVGLACVTVGMAQGDAPGNIVLYVSRDELAEWLVGRNVRFTIYAYETILTDSSK